MENISLSSNISWDTSLENKISVVIKESLKNLMKEEVDDELVAYVAVMVGNHKSMKDIFLELKEFIDESQARDFVENHLSNSIISLNSQFETKTEEKEPKSEKKIIHLGLNNNNKASINIPPLSTKRDNSLSENRVDLKSNHKERHNPRLIASAFDSIKNNKGVKRSIQVSDSSTFGSDEQSKIKVTTDLSASAKPFIPSIQNASTQAVAPSIPTTDQMNAIAQISGFENAQQMMSTMAMMFAGINPNSHGSGYRGRGLTRGRGFTSRGRFSGRGFSPRTSSNISDPAHTTAVKNDDHAVTEVKPTDNDTDNEKIPAIYKESSESIRGRGRGRGRIGSGRGFRGGRVSSGNLTWVRQADKDSALASHR